MRYLVSFCVMVCLLVSTMSFVAIGKQAFEQIAEFNVPEANQGIGVDALYFYAVDNRAIAKYDKQTGELVAKWEGSPDGPIIHLDSAVVVDGKIYCAHSNWHYWPMVSSIEIWDAATMEHIGSHSFGIHWGSCTWVDRYNGYWWVGFANYNRLYGPDNTFYSYIRGAGNLATTIVKFDDNWQWLEAWVLPKVMLEKFEDMSNSGGSWGPDGFLYLTGHDPAEVYKCKLPEAGSVIEVVDTIPLNIRGQGIAWDRSEPGVLYGIIRATKEERAQGITHKVTVHRLVTIKE